MYKHKVKYYETDKMGITHHSNYIRFMEEARTDFLENIGYGYYRMEREGVISPVVSISCEFKKTTTYPDEIDIYVKIKSVSAARITLGYEMKCGEETVFTAESSHCFLGTDGRIVSIKRTLPEFFELMSKLSEKEEI